MLTKLKTEKFLVLDQLLDRVLDLVKFQVWEQGLFNIQAQIRLKDSDVGNQIKQGIKNAY